MGLNRRILLGIAGSVALSLGVSGQALAQAYPSQQVRIVVPFSAGSATDILARIVADKLTGVWGQTVLVENRQEPGRWLHADADLERAHHRRRHQQGPVL
jgi:tripartite-type tricarboxylate transporter receptor subunit TctC